MPVKNKLKDYTKRELQKVFNAIKKGKMSVTEVATNLGVHSSTIRYHMNEGTYEIAKAA
jgi:predicted ArsR family transcriptional regulator